MHRNVTRPARRLAALVAAAAMFTVIGGTATASADTAQTVHVTDLPTSEPTVTLNWHPVDSGHVAIAASVSGAAPRHLRVQRSWSCPDGTTGAARVAHKAFRDGVANLPAAATMFQTNQTACTNPTAAQLLAVIVSRAGDSAAVTRYINPTQIGRWTDTDPFQTYATASYDGETCQQTSPGQWTVSDSFTVTGGVYRLLNASTTGNGNPDLTPQPTDTAVGYDGGPGALTFTIVNVYPYDPSGQTIGYRVCPNQGEAYLDIDFAFPDGTYAGEWELTHAWPPSIPTCS